MPASDAVGAKVSNTGYMGYTVSEQPGFIREEGPRRCNPLATRCSVTGYTVGRRRHGVTHCGRRVTPSETVCRVQNAPRCHGVTRVRRFRAVTP
jgi:hypothetical protein